MDTESENESIEGDLNEQVREQGADWGKAKYDYYYTDYVDKDYPSKLTAKEERLAAAEQEEALRIQKKLLSTLENQTIDLQTIIEDDSQQEDLIDYIETQNKAIEREFQTPGQKRSAKDKQKKVVQFEDIGSDECEFNDDDDDDDDGQGDRDDDDEDEDMEGGDSDDDDNSRLEETNGRRRRPINMAIKKNRGLTPYKKKEYRNPRVKHKLKFKKAMTKRRRLVREAQSEFHRYSGESTGIKTSTVKSIKLC